MPDCCFINMKIDDIFVYVLQMHFMKKFIFKNFKTLIHIFYKFLDQKL